MTALLSDGRVADMVPMGLVMDLLTQVEGLPGEPSVTAKMALARAESRWGQAEPPSRRSLAAFGAAAATLMVSMVDDTRRSALVERTLQRADAILRELQAPGLALYSVLLPSGIEHRIRRCAAALEAATDTSDPTPVEDAWSAVVEHRLAHLDTTLVPPFTAAVRLSRWLRTPDGSPSDLAGAVRRQVDDDSWVDAAVNDAEAGVDDPDLTRALNSVLTRVRSRRGGHDAQFAAHLAAQGASASGLDPSEGVWPIEDVIPTVVAPLCADLPVLLVVLDGMSTGVANEIVDDAVRRLGWFEALPRGLVLPSRGRLGAAVPDPRQPGLPARRTAR